MFRPVQTDYFTHIPPLPTRRPEACLSGIGATPPAYYSWYRLLFNATAVPPAGAAPEYLLNFGAVDWTATVWLNGVPLGGHVGGYTHFTLNATGALLPPGGGANELIVWAYDPSDAGFQVRRCLSSTRGWAQHMRSGRRLVRRVATARAAIPVALQRTTSRVAAALRMHLWTHIVFESFTAAITRHPDAHRLSTAAAAAQVNGKQRISAITDPGGDTYTPSSGACRAAADVVRPPLFASEGFPMRVYPVAAAVRGPTRTLTPLNPRRRHLADRVARGRARHGRHRAHHGPAHDARVVVRPLQRHNHRARRR